MIRPYDASRLVKKQVLSGVAAWNSSGSVRN